MIRVALRRKDPYSDQNLNDLGKPAMKTSGGRALWAQGIAPEKGPESSRLTAFKKYEKHRKTMWLEWSESQEES